MLRAAISRRIAIRLTHTNGLAKDMLMRRKRLVLGLSTAAAGLVVTLGSAPLAAADPPSNLGVIGPEESEPVWGMIGWKDRGRG